MKMARCVAGLLWPIATSVALAQGAPAIPSNAAYLASNCANCHGTTGNAKGAMPSLAGQPKAYLVEQMKAFRDGKRTATIMPQLAKGYTDAQIDAIAEFFSRQRAAR
ncbi:MAG TPA: c-type cytochrome [Burkholderiaceae bacterium]|nr:c-type cytochrome [Burkholderiaceae bacterium]HQR71647.1 c-type cytochrome [Burkholderiaceae bacterium]